MLHSTVGEPGYFDRLKVKGEVSIAYELVLFSLKNSV